MWKWVCFVNSTIGRATKYNGKSERASILFQFIQTSDTHSRTVVQCKWIPYEMPMCTWSTFCVTTQGRCTVRCISKKNVLPNFIALRRDWISLLLLNWCEYVNRIVLLTWRRSRVVRHKRIKKKRMQEKRHWNNSCDDVWESERMREKWVYSIKEIETDWWWWCFFFVVFIFSSFFLSFHLYRQLKRRKLIFPKTIFTLCLTESLGRNQANDVCVYVSTNIPR